MSGILFMLTNDRRVCIHSEDVILREIACRKDERQRLAQFTYSATVLAGSKPSFRFIDEPLHEKMT